MKWIANMLRRLTGTIDPEPTPLLTFQPEEPDQDQATAPIEQPAILVAPLAKTMAAVCALILLIRALRRARKRE